MRASKALVLCGLLVLSLAVTAHAIEAPPAAVPGAALEHPATPATAATALAALPAAGDRCPQGGVETTGESGGSTGALFAGGACSNLFCFGTGTTCTCSNGTRGVCFSGLCH